MNLKKDKGFNYYEGITTNYSKGAMESARAVIKKELPDGAPIPTVYKSKTSEEDNERKAQATISCNRKKELETFIGYVYKQNETKFDNCLKFRLKKELQTRDFSYIVIFRCFPEIAKKFLFETISSKEYAKLKQEYEEFGKAKDTGEELELCKRDIIIYTKKNGESDYEKYILTLPPNWATSSERYTIVIERIADLVEDELEVGEQDAIKKAVETGKVKSKQYM